MLCQTSDSFNVDNYTEEQRLKTKRFPFCLLEPMKTQIIWEKTGNMCTTIHIMCFLYNLTFLDSTEERPSSSRGRRPANQESANTPSPPVTPEHQAALRGGKNQSDTVSSPPESPEVTSDIQGGEVTPSQTTPREKGKRKPNGKC